MPLLEVDKLQVEFTTDEGRVRAVDGVSFEVEPGEILGFLGPNGAGKTTCFDILAGFLVPDAGEVCLAGRPLDGEARCAEGIVPQEINLNLWEKVGNTVANQAGYYGLSGVLAEYQAEGKLLNAEYVDILDVRFSSQHVNGGDCFHPSTAGHALMAEEQWCRSKWGEGDAVCAE